MSTIAMATVAAETSNERFELQARFFRILGDQTRVQILDHLLEGEKKVGELVQLLDSSQSRISNHLACLRWCGFVATRREGREIYYRVTDERVAEILELGRVVIAAHAEHLLNCARI